MNHAELYDVCITMPGMPRPRATEQPDPPAKRATRRRPGSSPQSVRFEPVFEQRVHAAAAHEGLSVSAFIREAVQERTDRVLGSAGLWDRIEAIVDSIPVTGEPSDSASSTHAVFGEVVAGRHVDRDKPWPPAPEA